MIRIVVSRFSMRFFAWGERPAAAAFRREEPNSQSQRGLVAFERTLDRTEQDRDDEQDKADNGKPEQALNEKPCDGKHSPDNEYEDQNSQHALRLSRK